MEEKENIEDKDVPDVGLFKLVSGETIIGLFDFELERIDDLNKIFIFEALLVTNEPDGVYLKPWMYGTNSKISEIKTKHIMCVNYSDESLTNVYLKYIEDIETEEFIDEQTKDIC